VKIDAIVGVLNTTSSSSTSSVSKTSTSSILSSATSSVPPNSVTATPSNSPVPGTDHSSLSGGAKAGIGIGVGLGALIVAAIVAYFAWWRRRKGEVGGPVAEVPTELPGTYQDGTAYQEMGSHKPEPFQHEVEGYIPVPRAELAEVRYH